MTSPNWIRNWGWDLYPPKALAAYCFLPTAYVY